MIEGIPARQLDRDPDRPAQDKRAKFGQEDRDPKRRWHGDGHRDERGDDRAINGRHRAEFLGHGIPRFSPKKA